MSLTCPRHFLPPVFPQQPWEGRHYHPITVKEKEDQRGSEIDLGLYKYKMPVPGLTPREYLFTELCSPPRPPTPPWILRHPFYVNVTNDGGWVPGPTRGTQLGPQLQDHLPSPRAMDKAFSPKRNQNFSSTPLI